jgi:anti-anti-sigma factor
MSEFESVLEFHQVLRAELGPDTVVVTPQGEASGFRYADIQTEYNRVYQLFEAPAVRFLVVDFSELEYIDSTFIGVCISLAKRTKAKGGRTVLCGIREPVRELLRRGQLIENAKFDFLWSEQPTREDAVRVLAEGK